MKSTQKIEIERKFLLKAMPCCIPVEIISIGQYYWKNKSNIWERARTYHSNVSGDRYIHTIKKSLSKSVNLEEEVDLTKDDFESFKIRCLSDLNNSKFINKERWVYDHPFDGLKWEVDVFDNGYKLIIAEIEIPKKTYKLVIPDLIKDVSLLEVTGLKQFSNRTLSLNLSDINKYK